MKHTNPDSEIEELRHLAHIVSNADTPHDAHEFLKNAKHQWQLEAVPEKKNLKDYEIQADKHIVAGFNEAVDEMIRNIKGEK